tara:strand:- start:653 stop:763 length:111 start_codon:yes stop_codon:yes gene_type:complete
MIYRGCEFHGDNLTQTDIILQIAIGSYQLDQKLFFS